MTTTTALPTIDHPTGQPNFTVVTIDDRDFYFSHKTCVAFRTMDTGLVVSENVWSKTTGKHLNCIDHRKANRVDHSTFIDMLERL